MGKIPLTLDNMVFSLQKTGGGSVYWQNLSASCLADGRFDVSFVEREDACANSNRQAMDLGSASFYADRGLPLRVDEVRSVSECSKGIFHSSFYRYANAPNVINITTVHDFICVKQYSGLLKWFSFWQIKRAVLHSDAIICISESTKHDLLEYVPEAAKCMITVIPQGFSSVYSYKRRDRKNRAVFIGARNVAYKNFKKAAESVRLVDGLGLAIIGAPLSSDEKAYLDEILPGRYVSYEYPSPSEVCDIFRESLALLYLSEYEGFGIPPLEAMSSGLPVIALRASSIPEVVGDAAVLLEKADPSSVAATLRSLGEQGDFFDERVAQGLSRAKEYSWEKTSKRTRDFYVEVWNKLGDC